MAQHSKLVLDFKFRDDVLFFGTCIIFIHQFNKLLSGKRTHYKIWLSENTLAQHKSITIIVLLHIFSTLVSSIPKTLPQFYSTLESVISKISILFEGRVEHVLDPVFWNGLTKLRVFSMPPVIRLLQFRGGICLVWVGIRLGYKLCGKNLSWTRQFLKP